MAAAARPASRAPSPGCWTSSVTNGSTSWASPWAARWPSNSPDQPPERVGGLVLAATGPGLGGIPGAPHVLLRLATPRRYREPEYYQRIAGRLYGGAARREAVALPGAGPGIVGPPSSWGYAGQLYAIAGWSSMPWLHRLPHPTLVMTGDDDPLVPAINSRLLAWRIPDSRLCVIRGGGHLFVLERPGEVADIVSASAS